MGVTSALRYATAAAAILLASCRLTPAQKDEVADIAGDAAGDAIADSDEVRELNEKIDALEARLTEVESRLGN